MIGKVMDARLRILLFAPEAACYVDLSVADRLEWEVVGDLVDSVGSMAQFAGRSDQWAPQVAKSIVAGICRAEALAGEATKSEPHPEIVALAGFHNEREIARVQGKGLEK